MTEEKRKKLNEDYLKKRMSIAELSAYYNISVQTVYNNLYEENRHSRYGDVHGGCQCPFFENNKYNKIFCSAQKEYKEILVFKDKTQKDKFKNKYCYGQYRRCSKYNDKYEL